jgi:hypothetical protein
MNILWIFDHEAQISDREPWNIRPSYDRGDVDPLSQILPNNSTSSLNMQLNWLVKLVLR